MMKWIECAFARVLSGDVWIEVYAAGKVSPERGGE